MQLMCMNRSSAGYVKGTLLLDIFVVDEDGEKTKVGNSVKFPDSSRYVITYKYMDQSIYTATVQEGLDAILQIHPKVVALISEWESLYWVVALFTQDALQLLKEGRILSVHLYSQQVHHRP